MSSPSNYPSRTSGTITPPPSASRLRHLHQEPKVTPAHEIRSSSPPLSPETELSFIPVKHRLAHTPNTAHITPRHKSMNHHKIVPIAPFSPPELSRAEFITKQNRDVLSLISTQVSRVGKEGSMKDKLTAAKRTVDALLEDFAANPLPPLGHSPSSLGDSDEIASPPWVSFDMYAHPAFVTVQSEASSSASHIVYPLHEWNYSLTSQSPSLSSTATSLPLLPNNSFASILDYDNAVRKWQTRLHLDTQTTSPSEDMFATHPSLAFLFENKDKRRHSIGASTEPRPIQSPATKSKESAPYSLTEPVQLRNKKQRRESKQKKGVKKEKKEKRRKEEQEKVQFTTLRDVMESDISLESKESIMNGIERVIDLIMGMKNPSLTRPTIPPSSPSIFPVATSEQNKASPAIAVLPPIEASFDNPQFTPPPSARSASGETGFGSERGEETKEKGEEVEESDQVKEEEEEEEGKEKEEQKEDEKK